ncbi:hypothetical protein [Rhodococcus sp. UNC363MFTsu5.1]|uniref:hypothetical protein n=1 Tax=Rhodococcus sp. UNC363MFTsu5.1 TaxID=1449069 RepID=UPI000486149B|nr:hypothetical protein [Rhodococcus sp. UNC363MFTsu5.1]
MTSYRVNARPGREDAHVYMVEEFVTGRWVEIGGPFTTWSAAQQCMERKATAGAQRPVPLTHDDLRAMVFATVAAVQRAQARVDRARDTYEAAISDLAEARLRSARVVAEQMAADRACADAQAAVRHKVR